MGTTPVRIPDETYDEVRDVAVKLDVSLSEAAQILLEEGLDGFVLSKYLTLDPDLQQESVEAGMRADTDTEALAKMDELERRQMDRNRERSDLVSGPQ